MIVQALVFFITLGLAANGQSVKGDSISTAKRFSLGDSIKASFTKKPKIVFRWDSHGSFITNTPARMTALGMGLRFGNYVKVGVAIDWLNSDIFRTKTVPADSGGGVDTVAAKLNYGMFSIYTNIVVARIKKWELTVPIELGFAGSSYTYTGNTGKRNEFAKGGLITFEPMFMAEYKIFRWLGVGAGLGLRVVPFGNKLMKENFNSLLWDANMSVYFGEIYRIIKGSIKKKQDENRRSKF